MAIRNGCGAYCGHSRRGLPVPITRWNDFASGEATKLREGNIENTLIYCAQQNESGPKKSDVLLHVVSPTSGLKEILTKALGVMAVVDKQTEIYYVANVKFHIDTVQGLGSFSRSKRRAMSTPITECYSDNAGTTSNSSPSGRMTWLPSRTAI